MKYLKFVFENNGINTLIDDKYNAYLINEATNNCASNTILINNYILENLKDFIDYDLSTTYNNIQAFALQESLDLIDITNTIITDIELTFEDKSYLLTNVVDKYIEEKHMAATDAQREAIRRANAQNAAERASNDTVGTYRNVRPGNPEILGSSAKPKEETTGTYRSTKPNKPEILGSSAKPKEETATSSAKSTTSGLGSIPTSKSSNAESARPTINPTISGLGSIPTSKPSNTKSTLSGILGHAYANAKYNISHAAKNAKGNIGKPLSRAKTNLFGGSSKSKSTSTNKK